MAVMVWESHYWKKELVRAIKRIERKTRQVTWPQRFYARLELDVMISFYMVRKLIEAKKLSQKILGACVPVSLIDPVGRP